MGGGEERGEPEGLGGSWEEPGSWGSGEPIRDGGGRPGYGTAATVGYKLVQTNPVVKTSGNGRKSQHPCDSGDLSRMRLTLR